MCIINLYYIQRTKNSKRKVQWISSLFAPQRNHIAWFLSFLSLHFQCCLVTSALDYLLLRFGQKVEIKKKISPRKLFGFKLPLLLSLFPQKFSFTLFLSMFGVQCIIPFQVINIRASLCERWCVGFSPIEKRDSISTFFTSFIQVQPNELMRLISSSFFPFLLFFEPITHSSWILNASTSLKLQWILMLLFSSFIFYPLLLLKQIPCRYFLFFQLVFRNLQIFPHIKKNKI